MKKRENLKRLANLKLHRETLLSLEKDLQVVRGGDAAPYPSVQFCTEGCTTTTG